MPSASSARPVPHTAAGQAGLAALLEVPRRALIGLDFDGTLAPIVTDPASARAYDGAVEALRRLAPLTGTLAVITGRPALSAVEYGHLDLVPGLIVLGHYGRERWEAGVLTAPDASPEVEAARRELPGVLAERGTVASIEDKGDALAVHTRRADEPAEELERLRGPLTDLAERVGLVVEPGRLVLELRPAGTDKGLALSELVVERNPSAVLFGGDDLGDLPAFRAVRRLRASGIPGLAVCSASSETSELARESDLIVDGPRGVVALLGQLADSFAMKNVASTD